ncbi:MULTISPECIES: EscV/YscV/HrcV family type III secretion system export apparatus protein [Dyella]|uniref:EscV/YscV/HrcV family type III secretion system export apparatus protein n=2 Tax=Dyella TaxID=231454 RepID=A0A4R0Z231_9GAMM|nr:MULTISPECIES: EscV/YscV/HrcV family type III secretion system export apparatus protein [Dyella]TBR38725.1 EscV/YscV/HrcV family type III secretion system export apparatus protein [Dyella terrae]TCI13684.1 EscV/YscV/HrcV family type III secretion system export apparatus protein [Dyella soli]
MSAEASATVAPWFHRPELTLVVLMAAVIAMLVMPLPTWLVDGLIALNMAIAIVIFLSSFYVERLLNFSTFPSVLLFTTLMRLALSVSTSRLILVDADAGHVIQAFGEFVIADNLVVGFVVFSIVTIVQFIVITKGAERVGEVTARFSLDGMPGKQMAIDADLRAESINSEEAQRRRKEVERESQLFGSFDGAMKFVKGDAIAGVVILLVNFFGGIAVGTLQHGMTFGDALHTFTLLTIGDGLVAQIPALLICISAGFIVTRVGGDQRNLGAGIIAELFASDLVLLVSAVLVLLLGMLPGFPLAVFVALACGLAGIVVMRRRRLRRHGDGEAAGAVSASGKASFDQGRLVSETLPLQVNLPGELMRAWEEQGWLQRCQEACFFQLGIPLPPLVARESDGDGTSVEVRVNEVAAARGHIVAGRTQMRGDVPHALLPGDAMELPDGRGGRSYWLAQDDVARWDDMGLRGRADIDVLVELVGIAIRRNISELFGIQEAKQMMDRLEGRYPELVKETYRHLPVQRLADVLQRLLREDVSVRNMKVILEALAQWAQREKDVIMLAEHVRCALARYISDRVGIDGRIKAIVLSGSVEDQIRSGIRQAQGGSFLNLDPAAANDLLDRAELCIGEVTLHCPDAVILTAVDIRRFFKRFIEGRLPHVGVISFGEVSDTVSIDVLRTL